MSTPKHRHQQQSKTQKAHNFNMNFELSPVMRGCTLEEDFDIVHNHCIAKGDQTHGDQQLSVIFAVKM